jgi:hypothetical protein
VGPACATRHVHRYAQRRPRDKRTTPATGRQHRCDSCYQHGARVVTAQRDERSMLQRDDVGWFRRLADALLTAAAARRLRQWRRSRTGRQLKMPNRVRPTERGARRWRRDADITNTTVPHAAPARLVGQHRVEVRNRPHRRDQKCTKHKRDMILHRTAPGSSSPDIIRSGLGPARRKRHPTSHGGSPQCKPTAQQRTRVRRRQSTDTTPVSGDVATAHHDTLRQNTRHTTTKLTGTATREHTRCGEQRPTASCAEGKTTSV